MMTSISTRLSFILAVLFSMILLLEIGGFTVRSESAHAQGPAFELALVKAQDTVSIAAGEYLVLVAQSSNMVLARGEFARVITKDSLQGPMIWLNDGGYSKLIPISQIGTLYTGKARNMGRSMNYCGALGLGLGLLTGLVVSATDPCIGPEIIPFTAGIGGGAFVLAGAVKGAAESSRATEYRLSPNDWKLVTKP